MKITKILVPANVAILAAGDKLSRAASAAEEMFVKALQKDIDKSGVEKPTIDISKPIGRKKNADKLLKLGYSFVGSWDTPEGATYEYNRGLAMIDVIYDGNDVEAKAWVDGYRFQNAAFRYLDEHSPDNKSIREFCKKAYGKKFNI